MPNSSASPHVRPSRQTRHLADERAGRARGVAARGVDALDEGHAVEDAGLTLAALANKRASVYIGICSWDYSILQLMPEARPAIDAYTNVGSSLCIAANRISYFFNLVGPSLAVDPACSSSLVATHLGCRSIWNACAALAPM